MTNKKVRIAIAIVVAIMGIGVLIALWVFRKAPDSVGSQKAVFEMDASAVVNAFIEDEQSANAQYLGKVLLVSGVIWSVEENSADSKISVTLKGNEQESGVICEFSYGSVDKTLLVKGKTVKVKGYCTGFLMDVVLNKCVVED